MLSSAKSKRTTLISGTTTSNILMLSILSKGDYLNPFFPLQVLIISLITISFLFDIAIQVATESTLTSDKDSVKECIDFVAVWFAARNKLQSLPADLQVPSFALLSVWDNGLNLLYRRAWFQDFLPMTKILQFACRSMMIQTCYFLSVLTSRNMLCKTARREFFSVNENTHRTSCIIICHPARADMSAR
jgi:hypothetical protein